MSVTPGMQGIWKGFEDQGLSERAISIIMNSRRDSTAKQYTPHIVRWFNFAKDKDIDPFQPTIAYVLDFLAEYFQYAGYSALNTARSDLSSFISVNNVPSCKKTCFSYSFYERGF